MTLKSNIYDHPNYVTSDAIEIPSLTGNGGSSKYVSFTGRQIKSVCLLPLTAGTSADVVTVVAVTTLPTTLTNASSSTAYTGTSTLTLLNVATFGSGSVVPQYVPLSGGTFTVKVINVSGTTTTTSTSTGVVFPQGNAGGVSVGANDQFQLVKGTDATVVYTAEIEYNYTPGTNFTL